MDIATTNAVERVARVLAGQRLSTNAEGGSQHAATMVDTQWPEFENEAVAVLKALREPDSAMERAGDIAVWQRMIEAALAGTGR